MARLWLLAVLSVLENLLTMRLNALVDAGWGWRSEEGTHTGVGIVRCDPIFTAGRFKCSALLALPAVDARAE